MFRLFCLAYLAVGAVVLWGCKDAQGRRIVRTHPRHCLIALPFWPYIVWQLWQDRGIAKITWRGRVVYERTFPREKEKRST